MKSRSLTFVAIAGLAGASALSCATQSAAAAAAAEQSAAAAASASAQPAPAAEPPLGPPHMAWQDMTREQRGQYMFKTVVPRMREVFNSFDGEKFPMIGCPTCHGKDGKARGFKMPSSDLFVLPATQEDWGKLMKEKPEWVKFMNEKVKPEMAALLGVKAFDPQNPEPGALGCSTCHASQKP